MADLNFAAATVSIGKALKAGKDDEAVDILVAQARALAGNISKAMQGAIVIDENEYALKMLAKLVVEFMKDAKGA